jgi:diacylglycerol kinase (ATP)
MTQAPIVLLVNPAAGRGRASRVAQAAQQALRDAGLSVVVHEARGRGDEARIAEAASIANAQALAVVGGDGAVSHAVRGLLDGEARGGARVPLAIFAAGTGNDFAKSLAVPVHHVQRMAAHVAAGATHVVDVGFVNDVPFVNAAGFGFDVDVLERMRTPGMLRGTAAYVSTALGALFRYRGFRANRATDSALMSRSLMTVFANGRCFGGAFRIAPDAQLDDGVLDCVTIRDVAPWARVPLFVRAMRGTHLASPNVSFQRERRFHLRFDAPPMFETDGELQQAASCDVFVHLRAGALTVIA